MAELGKVTAEVDVQVKFLTPDGEPTALCGGQQARLEAAKAAATLLRAKTMATIGSVDHIAVELLAEWILAGCHNRRPESAQVVRNPWVPN